MTRRVILPLIIVAVVLALLIGNAGRDMGALLNTFSTRFLGIFIEAAPFLLLGSLVSGLIENFISPADIARLIPRNRFLATISGALIGFVFPVCECGVVPVTRRLFSKGLPMSVGVAFLLASPVLNPIVLISTYTAFGWGAVLIGRVIITAVVACAVGLVFAARARPHQVLRAQSMATVAGAAHDDVLLQHGTPPRTLANRLRSAVTIAGDEFFDMGRYLIIGSLLAVSAQTLLAQDVLLSLGRGPVLSVITMQVLAFVLSVCSTVDAFLALAFRGVFTTGSILAFLTFGPMIDIKSTLMFLSVFNRKVVLYLILLPLLMTLLIGVWLNLNVVF